MAFSLLARYFGYNYPRMIYSVHGMAVRAEHWNHIQIRTPLLPSCPYKHSSRLRFFASCGCLPRSSRHLLEIEYCHWIDYNLRFLWRLKRVGRGDYSLTSTPFTFIRSGYHRYSDSALQFQNQGSYSWGSYKLSLQIVRASTITNSVFQIYGGGPAGYGFSVRANRHSVSWAPIMRNKNTSSPGLHMDCRTG